MNYKTMGRFLAQILGIEGLFMLPALLLCVIAGDSSASRAFLLTLLITAVICAALLLTCRKADPGGFYAREGLVCVGLGWIVLSLVGCLPFYFSGTIPHFIDALFETVSGFTTTGSTILSDVESMARGMMYWRCFSHWLGGMGVLVFLLAVAPTGQRGGFTIHLLRAESPGPSVGKLVPKMKQTALILYLLYIALTLVDFVFLICGEMNWFEALCTAFGTAGTGGFGIRNDGLASFSSYTQTVCTVFMLLFGVNFSCYYLILIGQVKSVLKDEELHLFLGIVFSSILLLTLNTRNLFSGIGEAVHHVAFTVGSLISSTGYSTVDFDQWPAFSKAIILLLMFCGACAGSTGGGFKMSRVLLLGKSTVRSVGQALFPRRVQVVRLNGRVVDETILSNTSAYLATYVLMFFISFLLISLDGYSVATNLSAVLSCLNNIGPGLDSVGPTCNFGGYSIFSKIVLIIDMLAGRLELYPILILFSASTWKRS